MTALQFADLHTAKRTITNLYPNAKDISFVEHSYDNLVGLVDRTYAVRFPRNEAALLRSRYEQTVLKDLEGVKSIALPKVITTLDEPPCVVVSFLPGEHLSPAEVTALPLDQQVQLGEDIASFTFYMHSTLDLHKARALREKFGLDKLREEPWDKYFKKLFSNALPDPEQDAIAKRYYDEWSKLRFSPDVVVHDDLHTENMLFKDGKLTGILDFGDTNIGSPEQELRQLYRINELVLEAAVRKYTELSGQSISLRAAQVWAIVQELAVCIRRFVNHEDNHPAYIRACHNLDRWLDSNIWCKDIEDVSTPSKQ